MFRLLSITLKENKIFVRFKHKESHWSVQRKKDKPVDKALNHFDEFYGKVFGKKWPSIRHGLLGKPKYVAVVNNYSDSEEIMAKLELQGAMNVRTLFELEKKYIKEEKRKADIQNKYDEVLRLDKKMDERNVAENAQDESIDKSEVKNDFSLQTSIQKAEHDLTRLVDLKHGQNTELLHQYVPATKIKGKEDWIPESEHYKYYEPKQFKINTLRDYTIHFPENLNVYTFEINNHTDFDPPKLGSTGVFSYYLLDGASLLPVLALDLKPGNTILDMCAAPGGKSLMALQTLYPERIVCNDVSGSRVDRLYTVFKQYLYDLNKRWLESGRLVIQRRDGLELQEGGYDRVLVDVPCTNDRRSVVENDNNIFKSVRIKERLKLPELQCDLLVNALKLVKPNGFVVYSTCSLSPVQNDGVVQMALKRIWEETRLEVAVMDCDEGLEQVRSVFKLAEKGVLRYGNLVVPYGSMNFGPMYFCKIKRIT